MEQPQKNQDLSLFKQAENGLDLKTEIQVNECFHVHQHQTSYISYYRLDDDYKMATKIIDLNRIKEKEQTKKQITKYLHRLRAFMRKIHRYQNNDLLPCHLLEICSLKNKNSIIYVSRRWIDGHNLFYYIFRRQTEFLQKIRIPQFIKKLIAIQTTCQGMKQHLLTETNLFIGSKMSIECNYTSMVGLGFLSGNQMVSKNEFYQIYPYLDSQILSREPLKRNNFNLKIRGIVVNLLKLIIGQEFNLLKDQKLQEQINPKDKQLTLPIVQGVSKLFKAFLDKNNKKIQKKQDQINQQWLQSNKFKLPLQFSKKLDLKKLFNDILVHQLPFTSFQAFIQEYFYQTQLNKKQKCFETLHNQCWNNEDPKKKKFLQEKGLHTLAFYLPVKWGIDLSKLFNTEFWFDYLIKNSEIDNEQILRMAHFVFEQIRALQLSKVSESQLKCQSFIQKFINQDKKYENIEQTIKSKQKTTFNTGSINKQILRVQQQNETSIKIANDLNEAYEIVRRVIKKNKMTIRQSLRSQKKEIIAMIPIISLL